MEQKEKRAMAEVDSSKIACNKEVISPSADPKWLASPTGGVKPMSIQGRLWRERERLAGCGMSEEEREWRKQWIKDQQLSKNEPKNVPEIRRELFNPIRRFYRYPMDCFEKFLAKGCGAGKNGAALIRHIVAKSAFGIFGVYAIFYYFKYNSNDWTRKGGWRVVRNRPAVYPGDPNWPYTPERTVGADYADQGFKDSPIQKPLDADAPKPDDVVHRLDVHRDEDVELTAKDLEDIFNYYKDNGE